VRNPSGFGFFASERHLSRPLSHSARPQFDLRKRLLSAVSNLQHGSKESGSKKSIDHFFMHHAEH
jgi:hypothetical protein